MSFAAILLGIGMVFVIEGLVFALAPSRLDDLVRLLAQIPFEARRLIGLIAVFFGVLIVSWALSLG
ncbi:MAG: DUF2065 domain-containing protein [Pseudomonadota bacterium]